MSLFQDFYRQEISAEEDVYRTLPFFATALGLIIAALNYAASHLPDWAVITKLCGAVTLDKTLFTSWAPCGWPVILAGILLLVAALSSAGVLWFLASATKRRDYERVGPEGAHLHRAHALHEYHRLNNLSGAELDGAVASDLREQLLTDYTEVIPRNRNLNLQRYRSRARAVSFLLWSMNEVDPVFRTSG
jgi:hypothetical protein